VICGYLSENFGFQELLAFHKIRPDILNLDIYSAAMRTWKKVCDFQLPFVLTLLFLLKRGKLRLMRCGCTVQLTSQLMIGFLQSVFTRVPSSYHFFYVVYNRKLLPS
jgi:hypothetical protein